MHDVAIGQQKTIGCEEETRSGAARLTGRTTATRRHWYARHLEVHDCRPNTLDCPDYCA
jgi:hypothetical protein